MKNIVCVTAEQSFWLPNYTSNTHLDISKPTNLSKHVLPSHILYYSVTKTKFIIMTKVWIGHRYKLASSHAPKEQRCSFCRPTPHSNVVNFSLYQNRTGVRRSADVNICQYNIKNVSTHQGSWSRNLSCVVVWMADHWDGVTAASWRENSSDWGPEILGMSLDAPAVQWARGGGGWHEARLVLVAP